MSNLTLRVSSLLAFAALAAGCAVQPATDEADTDLGEAIDSDSAAATGGPANATFYVFTRQDFNKCVYPRCSGFYVKRVNAELDASAKYRGKTQCLDSSWQADCYVSDADYGTIFERNGRAQDAFNSKLESGAAIVRAKLVASKLTGFKDVARLKVSEAWAAGSDVAPPASARFGRVTDPMIKCQAGAVCPDFFHTKLNVSGAQLGFNTLRFASHFSAANKAVARDALTANGADGILTAGDLPSGSPKKHTVQQFYLRADGVAPQACGEIYSPVCGDDGKTYGNECEANAAGASVVKNTTCGIAGNPCGGHRIQPMNCAEGFFCSYTVEDICGFADAGGTCAPKPQACTFIYKPVCGCDGKTYSNACIAASAGFSFQSTGACPR